MTYDKNHIGLYIHWPFCLSKCPYCDFNSHVRESINHADWRDALVQELLYYKDHTADKTISSIFFGGGTPSLMDPNTVQTLIDTVQQTWKITNDIEITLEANPTSIEYQKFKDFKTAGINRVSIGVQSLIDDDLKALGRTHSAGEALTAIEIARKTFNRYSFDLIYARSHQTLSAWENELSQALKHAEHHMSLYQLTIEPGTAFHTRFQRGDITIPQDDEAARFYTLTQDIMNDAGLPAYETSNHASTGEESRHNTTYWTYRPYIGIGPGAHGRVDFKDKRHATRTHRAPEEWLKRVINNGHGLHPTETLSNNDQAQEAIMMGLRLNDGISYDDFKSNLGIDLNSVINLEAVRHLRALGFLTQNKTHLQVTQSGMLCLNAILNRIL